MLWEEEWLKEALRKAEPGAATRPAGGCSGQHAAIATPAGPEAASSSASGPAASAVKQGAGVRGLNAVFKRKFSELKSGAVIDLDDSSSDGAVGEGRPSEGDLHHAAAADVPDADEQAAREMGLDFTF